MSDAPSPRARRAIEAALVLARRRGIAGEVSVLAESNHVVVRVGDAVAKVELEPATQGAASSLGREVAVAAWLAARGAAVVPPLDDPGPHDSDGATLTWWRFCPHDGRAEAAADVAGAALRALHQALAGYDAPLPSFTQQLDAARALLDGPQQLALSADDRRFLLALHRRLRQPLDALPAANVLHGEVHARQLLVTADGVRWHDFECVCRGPVEWDLTGLDDPASAHYGPHDGALLSHLRRLRQIAVVAWCAVAPERAPELREALDYHLSSLRASS